MADEKRTSERIATNILADIFNAGSGKKAGKASFFNMSLGGAGIESDFLMNEGDKLTLKFHLKKHKYDFSRLFVEGEIEVRWASLNGNKKFYGVKFMKMSVSDKHRIKEYLDFIKEKRKRGTGDDKKKL